MHNPDTVSVAKLEAQLVSLYGILLTREQLANVLNRKASGLSWELGRADSSLRQILEPATLRIGRRTFYRAPDLAIILAGGIAP
ncbi:hypothetical protein MFKK_06650 [Halopseudomonas aestusnigri]|nr:hypothetical protein MFKK_06650 [Halopseudomonas aestusnigri]